MKPRVSVALFLIISLVFSAELMAQDLLSREAKDYFNEGLHAQKANEIDKMMSAYQKALFLKSDYAGVYNNLGVFYAQRGQLDIAEENFQNGLKINDNSFVILKNLAMFYEVKGDIPKAYFYWKKALGIDKIKDYELAPEEKDELSTSKAKESQ